MIVVLGVIVGGMVVAMYLPDLRHGERGAVARIGFRTTDRAPRQRGALSRCYLTLLKRPATHHLR